MALFRNPLAPTPRNLNWMAAMNLIILALLAPAALILWLSLSPHFDSIATKVESLEPRLNQAADPTRLRRMLELERESNVEFMRDASDVASSMAGVAGALCFMTLANGVSLLLAARRLKTNDRDAVQNL